MRLKLSELKLKIENEEWMIISDKGFSYKPHQS